MILVILGSLLLAMGVGPVWFNLVMVACGLVYLFVSWKYALLKGE